MGSCLVLHCRKGVRSPRFLFTAEDAEENTSEDGEMGLSVLVVNYFFVMRAHCEGKVIYISDVTF